MNLAALRLFIASALVLVGGQALAQGSFPDAAGASHPGVVQMCLDATGKAVPANTAGQCGPGAETSAVNITQILGAAPSATNPLWFLPGTGANLAQETGGNLASILAKLPTNAAPMQQTGGSVSQVASTPVTGTLQSAAVANGNGSNLNTAGMSSAMLTVNCSACSGGTTVNFEGTQDGTNYSAINAVQLGTNTIASSTTASGIGVWETPVAGLSAIRARISGYSAGTITVTGTTEPVGYNPKVTVANTTPSAVTTTTANSTISVTNTFQAALASSTTRKSCLLQNTGTRTEQVYFGTIGSATTSNAFQINPGQTISCATPNGVVLTDAVNITGTAGDGYIVTNQ